MKNKIVSVVLMILSLLLVFGLVAAVLQVFTPYKPSDWFKKDDVFVDEPIVEEVLPLVATTEEEMNALLIAENVGRSVTYIGKTVKNVELPFESGQFYEWMSLDTSLNLDSFLEGLDWENPHFTETTTDFINNYRCLILQGDLVSVDEHFNNVNIEHEDGAEVLFTAVQIVQRSTNKPIAYALALPSAHIYWFIPDRSVDVDSLPEDGWDQRVLPTSFPVGAEIYLSGISQEYIDGGCYFVTFGSAKDVEEFDFAFIEIIFEKDAEYLIVANESDEGFHFEKL